MGFDNAERLYSLSSVRESSRQQAAMVIDQAVHYRDNQLGGARSVDRGYWRLIIWCRMSPVHKVFMFDDGRCADHRSQAPSVAYGFGAIVEGLKIESS